MRILNYRIFKTVYIKTEVTKLTPLPIENRSTSYNIAIPIIINNLPDNIMFISEVLLIEPNSVTNYTPKLITVGSTFNGAASLPKGVEIKIVILDGNESNMLTTISTESYKATESDGNMNVSILSPTDDPNKLMQSYYGKSETDKLLDIIDSKAHNEHEEESIISPIIVNTDNNLRVSPYTYDGKISLVNDALKVNKKSGGRRGRPKGSKNKKKTEEVNEDASKELASLLLTEEDNNINI